MISMMLFPPALHLLTRVRITPVVAQIWPLVIRKSREHSRILDKTCLKISR
uniref:Uncharacterized protein n=1 Tax=Arundo donax TaxID=35708 RepID=A0A0A9DVV7_ARUDO